MESPEVNRIQSLWNRNTAEQPMETAGRPRSRPALWQYLAETHLYPSPTGEEVAYCVIKSHSASPEKPYIHGHHVPNVLINQHWYMNLKVDSCGTQLRPLRPGASLAGTFTHLSMTVFVGRSVKDRPAAPCLRKKHKTEHLTTFFALSSRVWHTNTHTHTLLTHTHTRCVWGLLPVQFLVQSLPSVQISTPAWHYLRPWSPRATARRRNQAMIRCRGRQSTWGSREPIEGYQLYQRYPLVNIQKAMENDPFIDGLPIKIGDFP